MQPFFVGPFDVVGPRHLPTMYYEYAIIRPWGHPYGGVEYKWVYKFPDLRPISGCMWAMIQYRAIDTMERQYEVMLSGNHALYRTVTYPMTLSDL